VRRVEVDFWKASATVTYAEGRVDVDEMVAALSRAGYAATIAAQR
jgi:copper chaperone CopZ